MTNKIKKLRLECPVGWINNPIDGKINQTFFSNFLVELAEFDLPVTVIEARYGADQAPRFPEEGEIVFAYHGYVDEFGCNDRVFFLKEAPVRPLYSVDSCGYSGWSGINRNPENFQDLIANIPIEKAARIVDACKRDFLTTGSSKYPQAGLSEWTEEDYVFFPLQVPSDPVAKLSDISAKELLVKAAEVAERMQTKLVIKLHPFNDSDVLRDLVDHLRSTNKYVVVTDQNVHVLNKHARSVMAVNSGCSLEALILGASVWNSGTSEWWGAVNHIETLDDVEKVFSKVQPKVTNYQIKFVSFLLSRYWVDGTDRGRIRNRLNEIFSRFDLEKDTGIRKNAEQIQLVNHLLKVQAELDWLKRDRKRNIEKLQYLEAKVSQQKASAGKTADVTLSVVIPVYKTEKYLFDCLASIQEAFKGYRNLEVIVVDDGSPGNCPEIIKYFDDMHIVYIRHEKNLGVFTARLTGFRAATGRYVTTINSDDRLKSLDLDKLLSILDGVAPDILVFDICSGSDPETAVLEQALFPGNELLLRGHAEVWQQFIKSASWHLWGRFYRAEVIRKLVDFFGDRQIYVNMADDFLATVCLMSIAESLAYYQNVACYFYYQSENSLTRSGWEQDQEKCLDVLKQYERVYDSALEFLGSDEKYSGNIETFKQLWSYILTWHSKTFSKFYSTPEILKIVEKIYLKSVIIEKLAAENLSAAAALVNLKRGHFPKKPVGKIAILLERLNAGGAQQRTVDTANLLCSAYDLHIISEQPVAMKGVKLDGRVNVECIGGENRRYRLQKYLEANSVDTVLIAETWKHSSLIDAVWAKYLGFNVICREYSSYWFPYYSNQLQLMTEKQKVYSAVDALTCESENDKMLWRGTVPCIVEVLPGSVNAECDSENRVSRDNQLIFVGDVTHLNGRDFIPQIMSRISQKIKNVRLLVCGAFTSEGERYEFDQAVKNRGISENITVLGTVPNVCDRIKESRIVIRPTYAEEDSAAVDAALAFGVPVVVWNLTGRFGDQKEGVIRAEKFNGDAFADAVVNLLKDEAAWKLASENCLKGAARRSSENILNKWKCLFKKIQEGNTERNGSLLPPEVLNSINAGQEAIEYYLANHVHKRPVEYRDVIHEVVREVPCRYIPDDQLVKIRRYDKLKKVFDSLCPAGTKRKEIARSFVLAVGKKLVR